jgi:hypothetical protein
VSEVNLSDTVKDVRVTRAEASGPRAPSGIDLGARTHPGKARPNNEHNFHVARFRRFLLAVVSNLPACHAPEETDQPGAGEGGADGAGTRPGSSPAA